MIQSILYPNTTNVIHTDHDNLLPKKVSFCSFLLFQELNWIFANFVSFCKSTFLNSHFSSSNPFSYTLSLLLSLPKRLSLLHETEQRNRTNFSLMFVLLQWDFDGGDSPVSRHWSPHRFRNAESATKWWTPN